MTDTDDDRPVPDDPLAPDDEGTDGAAGGRDAKGVGDDPAARTEAPDDETPPPDDARAPGLAFRHDLRRAAGDDDAPTAAFE